MTDPLAELADRASSGDSTAVRALLAAIAPAMVGAIGAVLGRSDRDVEDVLQEALVGVVQALPTFRAESSVLHFARTIALRRALDQRRRRARRGREIELADEPEDESGTPAQDVLAARRRRAFRTLLEEVRPEQAEAFAQRVLFGYSIEEIAVQAGAPIDTIKSRLRLAKAALRARIKNDPTLLELSETDDDNAL